MITTKPIKISESEYRSCKIAVDENGDHWILKPNGEHIWVGKDESGVYEHGRYKCSAYEQGKEDAEKHGIEHREICVTDEVGCPAWVMAYIYKTGSIHCNDLDLDALAEGRIEWR